MCTTLGVLAFSQGCVLAHALLAANTDCLRRPGRQSNAIDPFVVVLIGGWPCREERFGGPCKGVRSLHVHGARDTRVPPVLSVELSEYFDDPMYLEHNGAHCIPVSAICRTTMTSFLETRMHEDLN
jgi:predicted esterase